MALQDVIRKVYRSLLESDENFGWDLKWVSIILCAADLSIDTNIVSMI